MCVRRCTSPSFPSAQNRHRGRAPPGQWLGSRLSVPEWRRKDVCQLQSPLGTQLRRRGGIRATAQWGLPGMGNGGSEESRPRTPEAWNPGPLMLQLRSTPARPGSGDSSSSVELTPDAPAPASPRLQSDYDDNPFGPSGDPDAGLSERPAG